MASEEEREQFRQYVPDLNVPRFQSMTKQDAHEYANDFERNKRPPWLYALYSHWLRLLEEPFRGVTNDGTVRPGLFPVQDEGVRIHEIVNAANDLLDKLTEQQKSAVLYHVDAPDWRTWSNPEFLLCDKGLRLDEVTPHIREAITTVLQQTLSPEGFSKAIAAMRINGFLGELVGSTAVCNEYSYNFVLFGVPTPTSPWGISFYGHHLCLNIFLYRTQIVISPWFTGAEPNIIDAGLHTGTRILHVEESLGLRLMQSLSTKLQRGAQVYKQLKDPAMPEGRWNHDDQRHLLGAYRDNRVVPYEGIPFTAFDGHQLDLAFAILEQYLLYLPAQSRALKLNHIRQFLHETYFCWVGGFTDEDQFYYRIQSPVVALEHHSGVFLSNSEPQRFHVHTLLRTPNGGDYGMALRPLIPGEVEQDFVWRESGQ